MRIFADPDLKYPIDEIHFGKVEIGQEKVIVVYLHNDSTAILSNLLYNFPTLPPSELLEVHGPTTIQPGKTEPLTLKWRPSMKFKKALSLPIEITGEEIYLAEETIVREKEIKE